MYIQSLLQQGFESLLCDRLAPSSCLQSKTPGPAARANRNIKNQVSEKKREAAIYLSQSARSSADQPPVMHEASCVRAAVIHKGLWKAKSQRANKPRNVAGRNTSSLLKPTASCGMLTQYEIPFQGCVGACISSDLQALLYRVLTAPIGRSQYAAVLIGSGKTETDGLAPEPSCGWTAKRHAK